MSEAPVEPSAKVDESAVVVNCTSNEEKSPNRNATTSPSRKRNNKSGKLLNCMSK